MVNQKPQIESRGRRRAQHLTGMHVDGHDASTRRSGRCLVFRSRRNGHVWLRRDLGARWKPLDRGAVRGRVEHRFGVTLQRLDDGKVDVRSRLRLSHDLSQNDFTGRVRHDSLKATLAAEVTIVRTFYARTARAVSDVKFGNLRLTNGIAGRSGREFFDILVINRLSSSDDVRGERTFRIVAFRSHFEVDARVQLRASDDGGNFLVRQIFSDDVIVEFFSNSNRLSTATFRWSCQLGPKSLPRGAPESFFV